MRTRPLRTLAAARDAVRKLHPRAPVTVLVHGGVYALDEPLTFAAADSGSSEAPITYAAAPNETPILSGGRRITGWQRGKDGNWTASVPQVREGHWYFHQLWVNGQRRRRARTPNEGYFTVEGEISFDAQSKFKFHERDIHPEWAGQGVEVISLLKWQYLRSPIAAVDEAARTVTLAGRRPQSGTERDPRYWIENSLDALDAPGEWYLDRKSGTLSYRPLPGEEMNTVETVAPHLEQLVRFDGAHHMGRASSSAT